jgi:glycosyltransferase involved in cell wall biosynthesis
MNCLNVHDKQLVSVIIPCFNAQKWVAHAIESCLSQTYSRIEIIVIDDGSTDDSLNIIKRYSDKILFESGPNRGGCHARNRGISLSQGVYLQFLDADDYLLPEKIEHQVRFLEDTGADIVYGDWRHQHHLPDGTIRMEAIVESGHRDDVLESLLSNWWVANMALLFRRGKVLEIGGWDEALPAAQDRDFFTSLAFAGADIRYQRGCQSIYRRFGNVTVSTGNLERWLTGHRLVLEKAERKLVNMHSDSTRLKKALAQSYFHIARSHFDLDRAEYRQLLAKTLELDQHFQPSESAMYNVVQKIFGFNLADHIASFKRKTSKLNV